MLTKPDLKDDEVEACLQGNYGLTVHQITFLPLGADFNTAVYRVTASDDKTYFLKLRQGGWNQASVKVPHYLACMGVRRVIAPLATKEGSLWADLALFKAILYPYIEGHNAVESPLSDKQWVEFGETLRRLHDMRIPDAITQGVKQETFSPQQRDRIKIFMKRIKTEVFKEPIAAQMASFLKTKSEEVQNLIERAESLAFELNKQPLQYVLCHADIHAWNLLVTKDGDFYIVDWDTLIFAPKERDLMFIGAGIAESNHTPIEEEHLFYQGYGKLPIQPKAIAYYRLERIIQDVVEYCEYIFLSDQGGEDRTQAFEYLKRNFEPNGPLVMANQGS